MQLRKRRPGAVYSTLFAAGILLALLVMGIPYAPTPAELADDDFRGRRELISAFTGLRYSMGDRVFHGVIVGKEGWFFYTRDASLEDYQRTDRISEGDLRRFHRAMSRLSEFMEARGGAALFLPAPNKSTIYPEYMPAEIPVLGSESWLDQIVEYSELHGTPGIVDVRPVLLRESRLQQLYFKTDSHWNDLGAYLAYVEIANALLPQFPQHQPLPLSAFSLETRLEARASDLARIMGGLTIRDDLPVLLPRVAARISRQTQVLSEESYMVFAENPDGGSTRVLVLGDSFLWGLQKFMELGYGSIIFAPWSEVPSAELYDWIRRYDPDVVIIECVERNLAIILPMLAGAYP